MIKFALLQRSSHLSCLDLFVCLLLVLLFFLPPRYQVFEIQDWKWNEMKEFQTQRLRFAGLTVAHLFLISHLRKLFSLRKKLLGWGKHINFHQCIENLNGLFYLFMRDILLGHQLLFTYLPTNLYWENKTFLGWSHLSSVMILCWASPSGKDGKSEVGGDEKHVQNCWMTLLEQNMTGNRMPWICALSSLSEKLFFLISFSHTSVHLVHIKHYDCLEVFLSSSYPSFLSILLFISFLSFSFRFF